MNLYLLEFSTVAYGGDTESCSYQKQVAYQKIHGIIDKENLGQRDFRNSRPKVFLVKGVLKICGKFTGEHPCRNVISIKLLCNSVEIAFQHGCSPVNLLHIFRSPFSKNTSRWLLLRLPWTLANFSEQLFLRASLGGYIWKDGTYIF